MSGTVEKFGRVFVSKVTDNNGERIYEQLRFTSFSNLDLKWYDLSGEEHPQFTQLKGNKFWMGLDIENTNRIGSRELYHGKLLLPYGIGEGVSSGLDIKYLEDVKAKEKELAVKLDLLDAEDDDEVKYFKKFACILAFFAPEGRKPEPSLLLSNLTMIMVIDDLLSGGDKNVDTKDLSEKIKRNRYAEMSKILRVNSKILKGEIEDAGGLWNKVSPNSIYGACGMGLHSFLQLQRYFTAAMEVCTEMRKQVLELVASEEDAEPFFSAMEQLYEACALQSCKEWNFEKDHILFIPAQEQLFKLTSGTGVICEAIALQLGIRLTPKIRSSFLFQGYCGEVACHNRKVRDLMSYNNEMTNKKFSYNEVYLLHTVKGMELTDALKKVNDDANVSVTRIVETGKLLLQMFQEDEDLKKYIEMVNGIVCGFIQSCGFVPRYHTNLTFDCYVDVD